MSIAYEVYKHGGVNPDDFQGGGRRGGGEGVGMMVNFLVDLFGQISIVILFSLLGMSSALISIYLAWKRRR